MQTMQQIVSPGANWKLAGTGRYFRLMESVEPITLRVYSMGRVVYEALNVEAGFYTTPDGGFDAVEVIATNNPQLVKIAISDGSGGYDRYTGTVNLALSSTVVNTGLKPVGISATLIVAANAGRRCVRFLNSGATVVYLGGGGIDLANGALKLNPGEMLFEGDAPAAAWYAVSDGGPGTLKVQEML